MSTLIAPSNVAEPELTEEEQQAWDYYEQEILKTLKKDKSVPYTSEFWDKIRADVEQRLQAKRAELIRFSRPLTVPQKSDIIRYYAETY